MNEEETDAYNMGKDCGRNGANTTNSHFSIFSTPEKTKAWEQGKAEVENEKPKQA